MLTPEILTGLEEQARKQIGPEMTTAVAVTPGVLRELVFGYRQFKRATECTADATDVLEGSP